MSGKFRNTNRTEGPSSASTASKRTRWPRTITIDDSIRDADMASEMVTFTRNNIMLQAGTAMLAQANQSPQAVLQLLR